MLLNSNATLQSVGIVANTKLVVQETFREVIEQEINVNPVYSVKCKNLVIMTVHLWDWTESV